MHTRTAQRLVCVAMLMTSLGAAAQPSGPTNLVSLPAPDGVTVFCDATAINNRDVPVGACGISPAVAVRWVDRLPQVLEGMLRPPGATDANSDAPVQSARAVAINDAGEIAASVVAWIGSTLRSRAAVWSDGYWRDLGLPSGATAVVVHGLSSSGDVIGTANFVTGTAPVIFEHDGGMIVLPPRAAGDRCIGFSINSAGQAVGQCQAADGRTYAMLWERGTPIVLAEPCGPGGADPSTHALARVITDAGLIGGVSNACASVWSARTPMVARVVAPEGTVNGANNRGELAGFLGINDGSGSTVGAYWRGADAPAQALSGGGGMSFLRAINARGRVVGLCEFAAGQQSACMSE